jgi:hypothetical protein
MEMEREKEKREGKGKRGEGKKKRVEGTHAFWNIHFKLASNKIQMAFISST